MNLFIVDDDHGIREMMEMALEQLGHTAATAADSHSALRHLRENPVDAIFLDLFLDGENGLHLLDNLKDRYPEVPVIMFTGHSSVPTAVDAMRRGAFDYLQKPFQAEAISQLLGRLQKHLDLRRRVEILESRIAATHPPDIFETASPKMQVLLETARRAAASGANILLLGPSGTGKSTLARHIHEHSPRRSETFVTVNCPSLSAELLQSELFGHVRGAFTGAVRETWGKVHTAHRGSLFLDEIGELPMSIQPKLLRLLQERAYERLGETRTRQADVRVIAATNRNLTEEVRNGLFREDLFYRLNVISLDMPPLSERPEDILPMANTYLRFFEENQGRSGLCISSQACQMLQNYPWPGNLRELRNTIERAVILATRNTLQIEDFPENMRSCSQIHPTTASLQSPTAHHPAPPAAPNPAPPSLASLEEQHIRQVLQNTSSFAEAASTLGIDVATLYRKRRRYHL